jgi:hypothetical protein
VFVGMHVQSSVYRCDRCSSIPLNSRLFFGCSDSSKSVDVMTGRPIHSWGFIMQRTGAVKLSSRHLEGKGDQQMATVKRTLSPLLLQAQRSNVEWVKGPGKQIQIVFTKICRFLIALYFSRLSVFSYKTLTLCRESLIFLEYPKKNRNFLSIAKLLSDINL